MKAFIKRLVSALEYEMPDVTYSYSDIELVGFIERGLEEATKFHIYIELDVYEFISLTLKHGHKFLESKIFAEDHEWLQSEYVPSSVKIAKIKPLFALAKKDDLTHGC